MKNKKPENPNIKFAIYESSGKYFIKIEGQDEKEISRFEYEELKDSKDRGLNQIQK